MSTTTTPNVLFLGQISNICFLKDLIVCLLLNYYCFKIAKVLQNHFVIITTWNRKKS